MPERSGKSLGNKAKANRTSFKPGAEWRGNAKGRPIGSRNRFAETYIGLFEKVFASDANKPLNPETLGEKILLKLAIMDPDGFFKAAGRILPKELALDEQSTGNFVDILKALGKASASKEE